MDYNRLKKLMLSFDSQAITIDNNEYWVSDEWLIGTFAGRAFIADTEEAAIKQMCDYFDKHINHDSLVGDIIVKSGWPDLNCVEEYMLTRYMSEDDKKLNEGVFLTAGWLEDLYDAIRIEDKTVCTNGRDHQIMAEGMRKALEIIKDHI